MGEEVQLYLASASPRRQELLRQIGVSFDVVPASIDETPQRGELPEHLVKRLALFKARTAEQQLIAEKRPNLPILGADTLVVCKGQVLGKPKNREHAFRMWRCMSGREHQVITAIAIVQGEQERIAISRSLVAFRTLDDAECEAYWQSGEPKDKAGAYAIQGFGAVFVRQLQGSYSAVVGLPLYETDQLLREISVY